MLDVAETSAEVDRAIKIPLYASAGIPEAWLVALAEECVEVYRGPGADGYREVRWVRRGEQLSALAFPDLALVVGDILGGPPSHSLSPSGGEDSER